MIKSSNDIVDFIINEMKRQGLRASALCRELNLNDRFLNQASNHGSISFYNAQRFLRRLGYRLDIVKYDALTRSRGERLVDAMELLATALQTTDETTRYMHASAVLEILEGLKDE